MNQPANALYLVIVEFLNLEGLGHGIGGQIGEFLDHLIVKHFVKLAVLVRPVDTGEFDHLGFSSIFVVGRPSTTRGGRRGRRRRLGQE